MALETVRRFQRETVNVATRHRARNVGVFGSVARGNNRPNSDIDFLVDVEPARTLLDVIALEQDVPPLARTVPDLLTSA